MSRREDCVWHPMPESVRRSSVQTRRASLAAGRRNNNNNSSSNNYSTNKPDWEVEAPPTPPNDDFSPRNPVNKAAVKPNNNNNNNIAKANEPVIISRNQSSSMRNEPNSVNVKEYGNSSMLQPADSPANVESQHGHEAAVSTVANESEKHSSHAGPMGKTRHTIRFNGSRWAQVLSESKDAVMDAFVVDAAEGGSLQRSEATRVKADMAGDVLVMSFVMNHPQGDRARMNGIHDRLQTYDFPHVTALYPHA